MEGATLSGRQAASYICSSGDELAALRKFITVKEAEKDVATADEPRLV